MDSFNWNLGTDDAAEVSPNTVPVIQPAQSAAPQAMSRRELREREARERGLRERRAVEPAAGSRFPAARVVGPRAVESRVAGSGAVEPRAIESGAVASSAETIGAKRTEVRTAKARKGSGRKESARPTGQDRPPRARAPRRIGGRRKFFSKLFSVGTMVGIAAIMVSTSLPANAFYNSADIPLPAKASSAQSQSQSMRVASTVAEPSVSRDAYTVSSLLEQLRLKYGNRNFSYTNDINGTIQWPFPVPVPISSGFGPRIAPCGGCSSMHEGVDFTPGRGVAIGSIADGVVSAVIASHSGLGNHVIVDHMINGQLVQSVYAHMLDGSFAVTVGEAVKVTQKLGEVGSTGESTGAHLHLEIHINGVPVDPFAWLKANAN